MLEHELRHQAGFDASYAFVFRVSDDRLRDQLMAEWNLSPAAPGEREPTSFVSLAAPAWWPGDLEARAEERYERFEPEHERYWSLWVDRDSGRVYAEYGRW